MPRYRNVNTSDEVEYAEPHPRLERLANWRRLDVPEQPAPRTEELTTWDSDTPVAVSAAPDPEIDMPALIERPADTGPGSSRADWLAYAKTLGGKSSDIEDMTRDQLRDAFGN